MSDVANILKNYDLTFDNLRALLLSEGEDKVLLFKKALEVKIKEVGNKVYFRGLIEFSNVCSKDCLYCGIRNSNNDVERYNLSDKQILDAAQFAWKNRYGSVVLQSGEIASSKFTERIANLVKEIKHLSNNELGITLSLGEQTEDVYKQWFEAGAHRYLLRIESSNEQLYNKIHPNNETHSFSKRVECLNILRKIGYQVGTGVMIGLPFQNIDDLVNDLLFMKQFNIDMVGMGPYIEHHQTPLFAFSEELMSIDKRFDLALKMVATLRLLMPDINIAAATALQAIDPLGREKAVKVGANIIMPNITPGIYRNHYQLYENKPCIDEEPEQCLGCLDARMALSDCEIGFGEWGDSKHYKSTKNIH